MAVQDEGRTTISLRVLPHLRDMIDRAARAVGKTRTEFMLDSARQQAEEVLLEKSLFLADDRAYAAFVRALEAPPPPPEKLARLLRRKAPWDA